MGNSSSTTPDDEFAEFDGIETLGYRVLGVQPNSPAAKAGLVSFLDFLVGANGQMLLGSGEDLDEGDEYDDVDFPALLEQNKGNPIELLVWNIKSQEQRFVELTPTDSWGGAGLLGVTIRLDNYGGADERLIRVLQVEDTSPAADAGLVPMKDYLLGTTFTAFGSTETLASILAQHINRVVEIYVYNSESDIVRVVGLMPNAAKLLGAEVGTGYLHRLPIKCRSSNGLSIERKVRWMNESRTGVTNERSREDGDGPGSNESVLEMEPHLEMELDKRSGNGCINPEDATRQPHELGKCEDTSAGAVGGGIDVARNEANGEGLANTLSTDDSTPEVKGKSDDITLKKETENQANASREPRVSPLSGDSSCENKNTEDSQVARIQDAVALFSGPPPLDQSISNVRES